MRFKAFLIGILATQIFCYTSNKALAQQAFSAQQAVDYALKNSPTIQNATLDVEIAKAKVNQTIAVGLPQISGSALLQHYPQVQSFVLENGKSFMVDPNKSPEAAVALALQLQNNFTGSIAATQLLFNGSYLVGLKASKTYQRLSVSQLREARVSLAEQIMKSYYGILVNREKTKLLDLNISRLDSTLNETKALFKNGFVEKIDLDRLEVSLNNLKSEKQKTERLLQLSENVLKLQMGMSVKEPIQLTSKLEDVAADNVLPADTVLDYNKRPEYQTLKTSRDLAMLDIKNVKAGYLPSLVGLATLGFNSAASRIRNLGNFNEEFRYMPYSFIGLSLNVPIFDGFEKRYKVQQSNLNLRKVSNGFKALENGIDLELRQANTNLANARTNLDIQKRNLKLAEEVVRVSKVKYKQGVGSNLEVTNAESSLKESQTNYYTALYDFIIAKIDLDKAQGVLLPE